MGYELLTRHYGCLDSPVSARRDLHPSGEVRPSLDHVVDVACCRGYVGKHEESRLDALDFALRVVNGPHPVRFDGWQPWRGAQGVGHIPPTDDEAAATVRILPPTPPDTWRLQARRRSGTVIRTSLPYSSYETAHAAVDYLATLAAITGDPQRAGLVTDTTLAGHRECACQTLGAHCLHYETEAPDDRGPDRGLSLGF